MNRVAGKIGLVTGGASGIGEAIARLLVTQGARVIIADIDDARGADLVRKIGRDVQFMHLDTTDESNWQQVTRDILATHGRLDILVNAAGIVLLGSVEQCTLEEWRKVQSVNADGVFLGCKHGVLLMKGTTVAGSIINIVSDSALRPTPFAVAYVCSKATVLNLTRATALLCAQERYPIRCNSLLPGVIETPMLEHLYSMAPDRTALRTALLSRYPMRREGTPEEVANAALFLASDEASFITGVALPVDGGCIGS